MGEQSDQPVIEKMKMDLKVTIKRRKLEYLRHIMRNESKYHFFVFQKKVYGRKPSPGRRTILWFKNMTFSLFDIT